MEIRTLGKIGLEVSAIGLGTEHVEKTKSAMDRVLCKAVEAGVTYVDLLHTAEDYWTRFGPIFAAHREKLILAAHWGAGPRYSPDYCRRTFEHILACVGNDHVEIALLTMVDNERKWSEWVPAALTQIRQYQEQGRVGHVAMSTHRAPMALRAVRSSLIDVLMYPLNLVSHAVGPDLHCLPCPQEIDVARVLKLAFWASFGLAEPGDARADILAAHAALPVDASACTGCGECVERCPFGVDVVAQMQRAVELCATAAGA